MTLTDIDAERSSAGYDAGHPAPSHSLPSHGGQADTWVFQLDLGVHGIAIDLTDSAWPQQLAQGLCELAPLLPSEVDLGDGDAADSTSDSTFGGGPVHPVLGASVLAFVNARTAELVNQGAVSILLLPTASELAPVAVGAVFIAPVHSGTMSLCTAALEDDGWTLSAPSSKDVEHVPGRADNALRGRRSVVIPGIAGLVLSEQLALLTNDDSVVTVLFQGASSESADDLSDSVIMTAVSTARLEKN